MPTYKLHLIPTDKTNAPICKVESAFQVKDFEGKVVIFEQDMLYNHSDLIRQVTTSRTFPEIKKMILEHIQPMHLYLTDNQRILKGMWCIKENTDRIYKATEHESAYNMTGDSRIICTSDVDFRQDIVVNFNGDKAIEQNVPNFHPVFINQYMIRNNHDEVLTNNIEPEMEVYGERDRTRFAVNEDNIMTVLIKVKMFDKKTYSRAELDKHLLAVMNLGMDLRQKQLNGDSHMSGVDILEQYKNDNL